ncbi:mitoguardin 1-like [Acipenser ruthenus]|uniref:mitoguardin 1-like n=1 Tax=Acipenser ruthenus TaxID=7906 RepID=UPI00274083D9|nr:mitoguardin 1-like [Acipenser ruthenus]
MKNFTFYDIFFDFIALNVIADTENVPTAVKQPLQNRWISVSMKKTTVMFYTWSRIKTKRAYMVEPKGFFYHLYEVYDYTHPEIMWAAFGPESKTKDFFFILKGQIIYFMKDMFSFKSHQFDTPDLLAKEIFENLEHRVKLLSFYLDEERKT